MRTLHRQSENERGVALLTVMFFALVAMAYAGSALSSVVAVRKQARYHEATLRAQEAAESGVHRALAELARPDLYDFDAEGILEGNLQGSSKAAVRYRVTLSRADSDGADNDQDGRVDEEDEADLLELESTGHCDQIARTVRVTLLARYRKLEAGAATYISDPNAKIGFNGNSFMISGFEHDLKGNKIPGSVPGIGTPGSPLDLVKQLKNNQKSKVIGSGGTPSVYEVPKLDMQDLIEEGARAATVTLHPTSTISQIEPGEWGTLSSPAIVYCSRALHVSGGASGAGMLIVNGDLTISGGFEWTGLIIVRGEVTFSGGGSGKRLTGALIVEKDLNATTSKSSLFTVNGTIDVLFSSQAVSSVMRSFATYTILNWREAPNPGEG